MRKRVQIAVDCADPTAMARFWAAALGYEAELPGPEEEDWSRAFDPAGGGPPLLFHRVPQPKVAKNRLHLDVKQSLPGTPIADRRPRVDAEVTRLGDLGATHVRTVEDEDYFAVMLDPEGNEFCVC